MESIAPPSGGLPGPHPEPTADLAEQRLPIQILEASTTFIRIHARDHGPINLSRSGDGRFDAPNGEYGMLYAGADAYCAFIENVAE